MNITSYTSILNSIASGTALTESVQNDQPEELYFVTEGWDDEHFDYLSENLNPSDFEQVLSESIFHGAGGHIISSIVNGGIKRGGEDSSVHVSTVTKKGQVYDHLRGHDEGDGEKHDSKHTIVRHNGKVIASIHPQGESGNIKYTANNQHDHATDEAGNQGSHISKGKAYDHIYHAIEKAGGYDGHKVELHSYKTDHTRSSKEESRSANKNSAGGAKSFADLAGRAATRVANKHANTGNVDSATSAHNTKIESKISTIRKHLKKASETGDYSKVAEHAGHLADLAKSHPGHGDNAQSFKFKNRDSADSLKQHAEFKGHDKDTGSSTPDSVSKRNSRIASSIKGLKEALKPTEGEQGDMFHRELHQTLRKGAWSNHLDQQNRNNKEIRGAQKSIEANYHAAGKHEEHDKKYGWKPTKAYEPEIKPRKYTDKDANDTQKSAAIISRAASWGNSAPRSK